ncbi:MAG: M28 family peptidase [Gemmatimonadaceae bacterium]|nr:M28 family peptidase [Gemmatimonadaceae bacterium]
MSLMVLLGATVAALSAPLTSAYAQSPMLGYGASAAAREREVEERFRGLVRADSISALHLPLARRPHPAGSEGSRAVIAYLRRTLESFGLVVETHDYQAWLSHPRRVRVTRLTPGARELDVREPRLAEDPTAAHAELADAFVAYSASGDVSGELIYVNYGLPADFDTLRARGVDARGRVAIARYGRSHRAVKVFAAQQAGATALILYSDPADDGFARGAAWPVGYWRGEQMPQRGNAKLSWYFHGDPLTPGVAATAGAQRLSPDSAPTLPRIPVVALAWGEAQHLLSALGGPLAPDAWRGGLPTGYRLGPGATARVEVALDDGLRPITNIVARLPGSMVTERTVMLGTHHDAWTFGAVDQGTGTAALLEVGRVLGAMARAGWRPTRSIALTFWDAEEYGLIGSTEYAEQWRRQLQEQLVVYVNTDMYMCGRFDAGGVPSLRDFVIDVARAVPGPPDDQQPTASPRSVLDGWRATEWARLATPQRTASAEQFTPELKALGSGADFVPFQDHLGVPTLSIEFIGANGYGFGTYHSSFDSRAYVERIADPGFAQGATMVQVLGTLALRMANAEVVPFRFSHYGTRLQEALGSAREWRAPAGVPLVRIDVAPLTAVAAEVTTLARRVEARIDERLASGAPLAPASAAQLNDRLARLEQVLADDDGAPDSRWYRHVFYGWNIYSLYDGQPFPGLAEAVRVGDVRRAAHEGERIARALARMRAELEGALALLER